MVNHGQPWSIEFGQLSIFYWFVLVFVDACWFLCIRFGSILHHFAWGFFSEHQGAWIVVDIFQRPVGGFSDTLLDLSFWRKNTLSVFDFLLLFAWAMDYDSWTVDHSHVRPMDHGHSHGHDNVLWTMAMAMVHGPWPWTWSMNQGPWAWSMAMAWSIAMAMVHGPWPLSWPSVAHGPWPWPWSMVHGHYHGRLWPIDHGHGHGPWFMDIGPWPWPWSWPWLTMVGSRILVKKVSNDFLLIILVSSSLWKNCSFEGVPGTVWEVDWVEANWIGKVLRSKM